MMKQKIGMKKLDLREKSRGWIKPERANDPSQVHAKELVITHQTSKTSELKKSESKKELQSMKSSVKDKRSNVYNDTQ